MPALGLPQRDAVQRVRGVADDERIADGGSADPPDPPARNRRDDIRPQRRRRSRTSPAVRSASWSTLQQFVTLGSSAVVGVLLARSLPVSDFGLYSTAMSLTAIGYAVMSGGVAALGIKALLDDPARQARTMSAIILLREGLTAVAFVVLLGAAGATGADATVPTAIALVSLFARACEAPEMWFQSQVRMAGVALARMAMVLLMLLVRVGFAVAGASLELFLVLYVIEAVLTSAAVLTTYLRAVDSPGLERPSPRAGGALLGESWPLLLGNLARQVNLRSDQVLLQATLGSVAVGTYAAAARLSELTYFLPVVFTTATFPALIQLRDRYGPGSPEYARSLQRSYDMACWVGAAIAAGTFSIGPLLIETLFGERYAAAGSVLRIHVLALPFVFMAAVLAKWQVMEGLLRPALMRQLAGAVVNVALNLVLVRRMGIEGAAVATAVSYTTSSYLFCFVGPAGLRQGGVQMTLALLLPLRVLRRSARRLTDPPRRH